MNDSEIEQRKPLNIRVPEGETGTELATVDYGEDAGAGGENITREEYRLPFLNLLQSNSPQCKPPTAGGVAGAKAGSMMNNATGELWDGEAGLDVMFCFREEKFPRYTRRDAGGGFVAVLEPGDPMIAPLREKHGRFGKLPVPDSEDELVQTFYLYGVFLPKDAVPFRAIVGFSSTKITVYQNFINRYLGLKYMGADGKLILPPLWAHRWHLGTKFQSNAKGDFYNFTLSLAARDKDGKELAPINSLVKRSDPLYAQGKEFYELIKAGSVKADYAAAEREAGADEDADSIPM